VAKRVTIPEDGTVLVGLTNPPTTAVTCQVAVIDYDRAPAYASVPVTAGNNGALVYLGSSGPALLLTWLVDAGETDSLSDFLEDNEGATIYVKAQPSPTSPVAYTYTCQACPGGDLLGTAGVPIVTSARLPVRARVKADI
jgi:hypothetical protein